jgi:hypothetical protein
MISCAVIMSLLVPIQIQVRQLDKFNLHEGYLINAAISSARIIGLPNLAKRARKNLDGYSQDVVWMIKQSNYEKKMTLREKYIRDLVN